MDFQVVVLAGGTSKKLVPLVSKVSHSKSLLLHSPSVLFAFALQNPFFFLVLIAGGAKSPTSGGQSTGSLIRVGAIRAQQY